MAQPINSQLYIASNLPLDSRMRLDYSLTAGNENNIRRITQPYEGLLVYSTVDKKHYKITSVTTVGSIVTNIEYEEFESGEMTPITNAEIINIINSNE